METILTKFLTWKKKKTNLLSNIFIASLAYERKGKLKTSAPR